MIVVVGGTGQLGTALVPRLLPLDRVRVVSRSGPTSGVLPEGVETVLADVRDDNAVRTATEGATVIISLVHGLMDPARQALEDIDVKGNARLAEASVRLRARFVMMSVIDAAPDAGPALFRKKWAAEQGVRGLEPATTILRAPAFIETWADVIRSTRGRSGRPMVLGQGRNPINFISVRDVAATLASLIQDGVTGSTIHVEGPDNVTMTDFARRVQLADRVVGKPRHVPVPVLQLMAHQPFVPMRARLAEVALAMDRDVMARDVDGPLEEGRRRGTTRVEAVLPVRLG